MEDAEEATFALILLLDITLLNSLIYNYSTIISLPQ